MDTADVAAPEAVLSSQLASRQVYFQQTFLRLQEKTELLRREYLATRLETAEVLGKSQMQEVRSAEALLWRALTEIDDAICPRCRLFLRPFPPGNGLLLTCTSCGFVAKAPKRIEML